MRLFPFGRKKSRDPIDEIQEARTRAMSYIRARRELSGPDGVGEGKQEWPVERVISPEEAQALSERQAEAAPGSDEPPVEAPAIAAVPEYLRKEEDAAAEPTTDVLAAATAVEPEPEPAAMSAPAADALGGLGDAGGGDDLLDLFQEAKEETDKGGLAGEVEDLSITDLLSEIETISKGLGMKPRGPIIHTIKLPDPEPEVEEAEEALPDEETELEPIAVKAITPVVAPEEIEPLPEVEIDEEEVVQLLHGHPIEPPKPETPANAHRGSRIGPPEAPAEHGGGSGTGPLLHVLFLALLLGGAVFSFNRIDFPNGGSAVAAEPVQTPGVLAVFKSPSVTATPQLRKTKAPTPTPSLAPLVTFPPTSRTATPTPVPPRMRDSSIPLPFYTYYVEYGDDLMSIAMAHGVCPDYLLWNNDRDEETPLRVGDEMLIPDVAGIIHTVKEGDTLQWIAVKYSSTTSAITSVPGNQVQSDADLVPGEQILVPGGIPQSAIEIDQEFIWATTVPSDYGYVWPFWGPLTTYYGEVRSNGYVHNAIDIGGLGRYGMSVVSIEEGTVIFVGEDYEFGQHVIVEHPDGSRSLYAHFSWVYVQQGDWVERSQALGGLGCTGASTGTHLHFELWRGGIPVDPLLYLN